MMTSKDIKFLVETFKPRIEVDEDLHQLEGRLNEKISSLEEKMATKDNFRQVMTVLDKVLKEVLAMRQDQDIHSISLN